MGYKINDNESEAENKKQITQIKDRLGHKYMKYDVCLNIMIWLCVLTNTKATFEAEFMKKVNRY